MDSSDNDVLMYFALPGGPVAADSTSELLQGDKLTFDFKAGFYFEAESFGFGLTLKDDEGGKDVKAGPYASRSYARWRAITQADAKPHPPFRAEPDEFTFSRLIDSASPILLRSCLDRNKFDKVVMVKRARSGDTPMKGVLRLEFDTVAIKGINWADGDAVRETCRFEFQGVKVSYVKRSSAGKPASSWASAWKREVGPTK